MPPFPAPETLIPHRPPQLYVHRIVSADTEDPEHPRLVAEYDARREDFPGHFPGRVVVPGVVYVEALAQALACLAGLSGEGGAFVLTGVDKARFKGVCLPPATLTLEIEVSERRFGLTWAKGKVRHDGALLCSVTLQAAAMPEEVARDVLGAG